jgi:hypothetical protein
LRPTHRCGRWASRWPSRTRTWRSSGWAVLGPIGSARGGVAAAGEVATLTGPEQPSQVLRPNHLGRLLRQSRRLHAVHGVGRQVTLGHRPLEEGVQAPVAVVGGGRLPAGKRIRYEHLDVLTLNFPGHTWVTVGLAVGGKEPDGVGVGLDGPGGSCSRPPGSAGDSGSGPGDDRGAAGGPRLPVADTTSFPSLGCGGAAGYGQRAPVRRVRGRRHSC